jgi:prolyl-tRNA synthetase
LEVHHDDKGMVWPKSVAPYQVHLIDLGKDDSTKEKAQALYIQLTEAGFEVLWDDRNIGAGGKFKDADLIGIPVRLVISARALEQGGLEWKERDSEESKIVSESDLVPSLSDYYAS